MTPAISADSHIVEPREVFDSVAKVYGERSPQIIKHPDILILEGLNVLQTGPALMVSDLFDFSVYVDARIEDIEQWYVNRFLG